MSPAYRTIHSRLSAQRGNAQLEMCVRCGGEARHWAYDNSGVDELVDLAGRIYSTNLERYIPMCVKCHRHMDMQAYPERFLRVPALAATNRAKTACLHGHDYTPENTLTRKNGTRTCRMCDLERKRRYYKERHGN